MQMFKKKRRLFPLELNQNAFYSVHRSSFYRLWSDAGLKTGRILCTWGWHEQIQTGESAFSCDKDVNQLVGSSWDADTDLFMIVLRFGQWRQSGFELRTHTSTQMCPELTRVVCYAGFGALNLIPVYLGHNLTTEKKLCTETCTHSGSVIRLGCWLFKSPHVKIELLTCSCWNWILVPNWTQGQALCY